MVFQTNDGSMDGIECLKQVRTNHSNVITIILTQQADMKFYRVLMSMGAQGYLLKSTIEDDFIRDFEKIVFDGESVSGKRDFGINQQKTRVGK